MSRSLFVAIVIFVGAACSDGGDGTAPNVGPSSSSSSSSSSGGETGPSDGGTPTQTGDGATTATPCPDGSPSLYDRSSCPGTAPSEPTLSSNLAAAAPGATISLGDFTTTDAPCLPVHVCAAASSATLFFSDSPESPATDGVLYADTLGAGVYRIYVYHTNGDTAVRKFPVVVLNQGATDAQVTITRRGMAPPSTDYLAVGKTALTNWLGDRSNIAVPVPAGQRVLLDADLDALHATTNQLVHAIYDVETNGTLKLSTVSLAANEDAAAATAGLGLLPRQDTHQRGTFPNADIVIVPVGTTLDGVRRLRLGSDDVDPPRAGTDATTGQPQTLAGNFGVAYRLSFSALTQVRVAVSPRGGAWAGGASQGTSNTSLPNDADAIAQSNEAVDVGPTGANDITLGTGGGSSLPVDLLFVP